jgi:hypothetical protein
MSNPLSTLSHHEEKELFDMACNIYEIETAGGTVRLGERSGCRSGSPKVRDWVIDFLACTEEKNLPILERFYRLNRYCAPHLRERFWNMVREKGLDAEGWKIYRIFY